MFISLQQLLDECTFGTIARLTLLYFYRTAACCLTGSLVWSWAMQSTSAMLEVCAEPPPATHSLSMKPCLSRERSAPVVP